MWLLEFHLLVVLFSSTCLPSLNAAAYKEIETSNVKLDLVKKTINKAKALYPRRGDEKGESNVTANGPATKAIFDENRPMDCTDVQTMVSNSSGVYKIWPRIGVANYSVGFKVYCDMKTDRGGWTVIQRRGKFSNQTDFYQDWDTYKNGFGDIWKEFWLGNEKIFALTNQGNYSVRFDLVDNKREYRYASYNSFSIGDDNSDYVLSIKNHSGNATDSMLYNHGSRFTTKDRPNDRREEGTSCAKMYQSAFWFDPGCGFANLNGIYQPGIVSDKSIWWFNWKRTYECLYSVEIKIRRITI